ncbi:hypothetical protein FOZ62_018386, partial [Perkinsus olseni]
PGLTGKGVPQGWVTRMGRPEAEWCYKNKRGCELVKRDLPRDALSYVDPGQMAVIAPKLPHPSAFTPLSVFFWSPKSTFEFQFTCPECSRALQSKGIYPSAKLIEGSGGRVWFCQERYQCPASHAGGKAAKDFRSSDNRLLSQLPICLREQLPYTQSYLSGVETRILNFLLDRRGNALSIAGLSRMVETLQRAEYERAELAYYSACHRHQVLARV